MALLPHHQMNQEGLWLCKYVFACPLIRRQELSLFQHICLTKPAGHLSLFGGFQTCGWIILKGCCHCTNPTCVPQQLGSFFPQSGNAALQAMGWRTNIHPFFSLSAMSQLLKNISVLLKMFTKKGKPKYPSSDIFHQPAYTFPSHSWPISPMLLISFILDLNSLIIFFALLA